MKTIRHSLATKTHIQKQTNIQYHDFDNQDSLTFTDKYTALLQQELQNPYWNLHDPITTKSYQISKDMDRMTPATLSPTPLAYEKPIHPTEMPRITTCTELPVDDTNKSTSDDKYTWLDPDNIRRNMTDTEILRMKLNLKDSVLHEKGKEEFLTNVEQFTDIFCLRDEIGTCPFIEVHLKLKDETPFFIRPYPVREEQKKVIQKEMDRLKHLGIIRKGLTG